MDEMEEADERIRLDEIEARLLGVLVEKELTTPDQYPLSLNALLTGANQKSNRDPVMALTEAEVRLCIDGLRMKHLLGMLAPGTGRVWRYRHTAGVTLGLPVPVLATLAELLLRGPQAQGELRARVQRMAEVESLDDLRSHLETLIAKGYACELPPSPGSRARRYAQLLCSDVVSVSAPEVAPAAGVDQDSERAPTSPAPAAAPARGRIEALEAEVALLRRQLQSLADALGETLPD